MDHVVKAASCQVIKTLCSWTGRGAQNTALTVVTDGADSERFETDVRLTRSSSELAFKIPWFKLPLFPQGLASPVKAGVYCVDR